MFQYCLPCKKMKRNLMREIFISIVIIIYFASNIISQDAESNTLKPILLDKSVLSGVGLEKIDIKDDPDKDFYQKQLYRGTDISVYVVSTETWNNKMNDFPFDEFIYMFHGEAIVKPDKGAVQLFYSGDYFFAPKGFTGEWEIKAGTNLHYELSVISTSRSESNSYAIDNQHKLFTKSNLSGAAIELNTKGRYTKLLEKGVELTIRLEAEKSGKTTQLESSTEKMIQLLSGMVTITENDGGSQSFYTGDFFVIPRGYSGTWESTGHGVVKYLSVQKS